LTLTKVILADDHQFLLEGIISVLKDVEEIDIVATVNNGYELLDAVNKHRPQLVVLDLNMPQLDGLQSLKKIKESFPLTKVLVLTNYSHTELQEETKKNLADGYLVKNSSAAELKKAKNCPMHRSMIKNLVLPPAY
jgi:DNA-binding NarL/FixJ family response regulator